MRRPITAPRSASRAAWLTCALLILAGAVRRHRRTGRAPTPATAAPLSAAQLRYLTLAQAGVSRAKQRFRDARRHWYDARLGDRERYPLATIWDIVPLFESIDAIAIAQPQRAQPGGRAELRRRGRALPQPRPAPAGGLLALPGRPRGRHRDLVRRQRLVGARVRERLPRHRLAALPARRRTGAALHRRRRLGPPRRRHLVEHAPPLQGRRGARLRHPAGDAAVRRHALQLRPRPGREVPRLGQHHRLQPGRRAVRGQQHRHRPRSTTSRAR